MRQAARMGLILAAFMLAPALMAADTTPAADKATDAAGPVFSNPGLPPRFAIAITDHLDLTRGYVTACVKVAIEENATGTCYTVTALEGDVYATETKLNPVDLTSISEKRVDLQSGAVIEHYALLGDNRVHFFNQDKEIDREFLVTDRNIYTRYAYFISFMGFPFESASEVTFKTYMYEQGDALPMRVRNLGRHRIEVKAGLFDCYKLELSVAGWQGWFASDKYFLFFNAEPPHHFVRYDEKGDDGAWYSNELVSYAVE